MVCPLTLNLRFQSVAEATNEREIPGWRSIFKLLTNLELVQDAVDDVDD